MTAPAHGAVGEADRTGKVAGVVDLNDGEAAMLLMIRAEAAIPGAAAFGAAGIVEWAVARLQPAPDPEPVVGILLDQRLGDAVVGAALLVKDLPFLANNLGRNELPAGLAKAGRLAVEYPRHALANEVRGFGERVHRRQGHKGSSPAREAGTG